MKKARGFADLVRRPLSALFLWLVWTFSMAPPADSQDVGEVFRDCDVCPEMVVVPPGSFMMGSPSSEPGRGEDEGPQHQVAIDYTFAVGVFEIALDEWDACVNAGGCGDHEPGDEGWGRGRRPVINVSWEDAWLYADWLTEQTGREYRLLSEAEWEYVARAGTRTARYWGETAHEQCRYANGYDAVGHAEISLDIWEPVGCRDMQARTGPVGSYRPNPFGLYDVLGNVGEWVDDCANSTYENVPTDGSPRYSGECSSRVVRGGTWINPPRNLRSALRLMRSADFRASVFGFRLARTLN